MKVDQALSIVDLQRMAKRRLPRMLFDAVESGVEREMGLARNETSFHDFRLLPRYLGNIAEREQSTFCLGQKFAMPWGLAPTGLAGLFRRGADEAMAHAARQADIPFVLSGASVASIEEIAAIAAHHVWFHLYPAKSTSISEDQLRRARDCGVNTLVLTVDNPIFPKRERERRSGFGLPPKLTVGNVLESLMHTGWIAEYVRRGGMPLLKSWAPYAASGASALEVAAFFRSQSPSLQTWRELDVFRKLWPGNLVLKGIQHPDDAVRAIHAGVNAIAVSNHGGKSFDALPSPLETLPAIRAAVGPQATLLLDSGVRRGSDVVIARCLGADFVLLGRATLYGAIAGGRRGVERAIEIIREEIDMTLAMIGCADVNALGPEFLLGPRRYDMDRHFKEHVGKDDRDLSRRNAKL